METSSQHEVSSLSAYLRVLRRRKWIVLACVILAPLTAYVVSARQTALYQASAQVYLSSQDLAGALTGISAPYVDEQRLADTQSALAQVPAVASRAIKISGVKGISPEGLLGSTSVVPGGNTNILTFTVTSTNPRQAELLATAYAKAFTSYRGQLDSDAVRRARVEISKQLDRLTASGLDNGKLAVSLRDKDQQLATLQALQTSRTYVIREADGAFQIAPTPRKNALIGLMLGLVLGLGLAFGIEALDTRVRTSSEVGDRLGLPLLARIPPPPKAFSKDDRLVMLAQPTGTNAETFRMLRTNLDFAMLEHEGPRTVLVTSASRARESRRPRRTWPSRRHARAGAWRSSISTCASPTSTASSGSRTPRGSPTSRSGTSSSALLYGGSISARGLRSHPRRNTHPARTGT